MKVKMNLGREDGPLIMNRGTFNIQHSTFNVEHPMKLPDPHLIGLRSGLRSAASARQATATARQAPALCMKPGTFNTQHSTSNIQ
jgi:hypothetical protein